MGRLGRTATGIDSGRNIGGDRESFADDLNLVELRKVAQREGPQVIPVLSSDDSLNVPEENKLDLAVVCDVYHHFEFPLTVLGSIKRALSPDGRLVIIDFHRDSSKIHSRPHGWVEDHVRCSQGHSHQSHATHAIHTRSPETVQREVEQAGFVRVDVELRDSPFTENYIMVFRPKENNK
jgi:SAM-dependent methyltransferase